MIPVEAAGEMSAAAHSGALNIALLAIDAVCSVDFEFSAAYLEMEGAYLVPRGPSLHGNADVDRKDVRIAVAANSAYDLFLRLELHHACLVCAQSTPLSIEMPTT